MENVIRSHTGRLTHPPYDRFKAYSHLEARSILYGHWYVVFGFMPSGIIRAEQK